METYGAKYEKQGIFVIMYTSISRGMVILGGRKWPSRQNNDWKALKHQYKCIALTGRKFDLFYIPQRELLGMQVRPVA